MTDNPSNAGRQRLRHQLAAERLLENSSLRDALTDDQAQQLLDWGLAYVERAVARTVHLPDDDAEPVLDKEVTAVSRVMKQVNRLVDGAAVMDDTEAQERLHELAGNLGYLRRRPLDAATLTEMENAVAQRQELEGEGLYNRLITLITGHDEEG